MSSNSYIGVEQEFVSFNSGIGPKSCLDYTRYFEKIREMEGNYFAKSSTAIRTKTGHAVYVDGRELEVCTPPVRLNKGFASRLTDLVILGREKIVRATPDLAHTGLSMHWNISQPTRSNNQNQFYRGFALPFLLFGATPISGGINMRAKREGSNRYEFLGDYLSIEEQINALALLMGSYSYAVQNTDSILPISLSDKTVISVGDRLPLFCPDGRFSKVFSTFPTRNEPEKITAQKYLELFYEWVSPFAKNLGSKREVENLKAFVLGNKKLEFDYFSYFAHVLSNGGKKMGTYYPIGIPKQDVPHKTVVLSGKVRNLPLEGKLLGSFIENDEKLEIRSFEWDSIGLSGSIHKELDSIDDIYSFAERKLCSDVHLDSSPNLSELRSTIKLIPSDTQLGPKTYSPKQDLFKKSWSENMNVFLNDFLGLTRKTGLYFLLTASIFAATSYFTLPHFYNSRRVNERVEELVSRYSRSDTNQTNSTNSTNCVPQLNSSTTD
jgi:hypothetical protein